MIRRLFVALTLAAMVCAVPGSSMPAQAPKGGCRGLKWCVETEQFAFRVMENELTLEILRSMEKSGTQVEPVIDYLTRDGHRLYLALLRPTPSMHSIQFPWEVGLELTSGERIWADNWFTIEGGGVRQYSRAQTKLFTPGVNGVSGSGNSFMVILAFPDQASGGSWSSRKVSGLVIEPPGVSVASRTGDNTNVPR